MSHDPPNNETTGDAPEWFTPLSCAQCAEGAGLDFDFTMTFQPIVDVDEGEVYAYEALVRGTDGSGAGSILARVDALNR